MIAEMTILSSDALFDLAVRFDCLSWVERYVGRKLTDVEARKLGDYYQQIEEAEAMECGPTAEQLADLMARNPETA